MPRIMHQTLPALGMKVVRLHGDRQEPIRGEKTMRMKV